MRGARTVLILVVPVLVLFFSASFSSPPATNSKTSPLPAASEQNVFPVMPAPGAKVWIDADSYFVYGFDKKPKLGTIILKVELFRKNGTRDTSCDFFADAGMPSMQGAHETGDRKFQCSKKGAYLLPIPIVMPGGWEIRLTVKKAGAVIFRGSHQFNV